MLTYEEVLTVHELTDHMRMLLADGRSYESILRWLTENEDASQIMRTDKDDSARRFIQLFLGLDDGVREAYKQQSLTAAEPDPCDLCGTDFS